MNHYVKDATETIATMQSRLDWLHEVNPAPILRQTRHGSYWETTEQRIMALEEAIEKWTEYRDLCKQRPTQGKQRTVPDKLIPETDSAHWECSFCMLRTWEKQAPDECRECGNKRFNRIEETPFERTFRGYTEVYCCGDWLVCDGYEEYCASGQHCYTYGGQAVIGRLQQCIHQRMGGDCDCGSY